MGYFDDPKFHQSADPKIGQPEELSFAEKYLAPALESLGLGNVAGGNVRGSAVGRLAMGAADPGVALVQMGANAIGQGDAVNKGIQETEQQYQDARKQAGSEGFDPARMTGNALMSTFMAAAAPNVGFLDKAAPVVKAGVQGAGYGLLQPVTDGGDHYWAEKGKQGALGGVTGAGTSLLGGMLARVISPNASTNADVQLLRESGVKPTVGQTLGGWANTLEEKAQSIPFLGDRISAMRRKSMEQFNEAAVNRAVEPVGAKVNPGSGGGQKLVAGAGDLLSNEYNVALGQLHHVDFNTPGFNQGLQQVQTAARGLSEPMQRKLDQTLNDVVLRRMDASGTMTGEAFKSADSELGKIIGRYGKGGPAEQEFADAAAILRTALKKEVISANPGVGARLGAADEGWANLVRVEGASKAAKNNSGVFTPAQLNSAIQGADNSVRGRAVSRGEALMQDLGNAGQNVLGNKYPDSGTIGRGLAAGIGLGAGLIHPAIPLGLAAGSAAYTAPVQNFLRMLVADRPGTAPKVANELRRLLASSTSVTVPAVEAMRR